MMNEFSLLSALDARSGITLAVVKGVADDDTVVVEVEGADGSGQPCDLLQTHEHDRLHLEPGDKVLVAGAGSLARGVILGRLGAPRAVEKLMAELPAAEVPDELVLEAKHSLTLRVGEGSITIREDGKILIKGKDLVSHAQRLNRIKGGAVSIN